MTIGRKSLKTKIIKQTLNPRWNERMLLYGWPDGQMEERETGAKKDIESQWKGNKGQRRTKREPVGREQGSAEIRVSCRRQRHGRGRRCLRSVCTFALVRPALLALRNFRLMPARLFESGPYCSKITDVTDEIVFNVFDWDFLSKGTCPGRSFADFRAMLAGAVV